MVRWAQYAAEKGSGSFLEGGGRRGRAAPTTQGRGPRPPPLRWFRGPSGPAKRRRPPGDPPGRPVGGGDVQGPGPLALAPEQARCRAQPGSGRVGVAHPPPPPPAAGISTNAKKATQKPGPTLYGAWLLKRSQEGARQRLHPLGQSPGPRSTGPGGLNRSAAGYRRKPPTAVVARLSPCA